MEKEYTVDYIAKLTQTANQTRGEIFYKYGWQKKEPFSDGDVRLIIECHEQALYLLIRPILSGILTKQPINPLCTSRAESKGFLIGSSKPTHRDVPLS